MSTVQVTKTCAKNTFEALDGLAKFAGVVRQQLDDGWQSGKDIPPILASAVGDLAGIIKNLGDISGEAAGDKTEFYNAVGVGVGEILGALRK